ncbi:hypothetical protein [Saccharothrix syringae]|uniref:hypothetical protein n=1 Tax=Saccharothrix syringae TaxID=103733 RepID=UPI0012931B82|nr:hypothetical protein [Saccharothrix syringae]
MDDPTREVHGLEIRAVAGLPGGTRAEYGEIFRSELHDLARDDVGRWGRPR